MSRRMAASFRFLVVACALLAFANSQTPVPSQRPDNSQEQPEVSDVPEIERPEVPDDIEEGLGDIRLSTEELQVLAILRNNTNLDLKGLPLALVKKIVQTLLKGPMWLKNAVAGVNLLDMQEAMRNQTIHEMIPPILLPVLSREVLMSFASSLGNQTMQQMLMSKICAAMTEERVPKQAIDAFAERFSNKTASCGEVLRMFNVMVERSASQSRDVLDALIEENGPVNDWPYETVAENWADIVDSLSRDEMRSLTGFLDQLKEAGLFDASSLPEDVRRMISNIKRANGPPPSQWTGDDIRENLENFANMPKQDMDNLDDELLANVNVLGAGMGPARRATVANKICPLYKQNDTLRNANLEQFVALCAGKESMDMLGAQELFENMGEFSRDKMKAPQIRLAMKKMGNLMGNATREELRGMKDFLNEAPRSVLSGINRTVLGEIAADLKDVDFEKNAKRDIVRANLESKGKSLSQLTEDDLDDLGALVGPMPAEELDLIPENAIRGALKNGTFADSELPKICIKKFTEVALSEGADRRRRQAGDTDCPSKEIVSGLGVNIGKALGAGKLKKCDVTNMGILDGDMDFTASFSDEQIRTLGKKIMNATGGPGGGNFSVDTLINFKTLVTAGMPVDNIDDITDELGDFDEIMEQFSEVDDRLSFPQIKHLKKKIFEQYNEFNSEDDVANMTDLRARQMGKLFKLMNATELARFRGKSVCQTIINQIGDADLNAMNEGKMEVLTEAALKSCAVVNETSGDILDVSEESNLGTDVLTSLGKLKCFLSQNRIEALSGEALDDHMKDLGECPWSATKIRALKNACKDKRPQFFNGTAADIVRLGNVIGYLDGEDRAKLNSSEVAVAAGDLAESRQARKLACKKRKMGGDLHGACNDGVDDIEQADEVVRDIVINSLQEGNADNTETRRRRRRQADSGSPLLCSDVQTSGDAISADQVNSMANSEFQDCIETFSEWDTWDESALEALVTQLKATYGSDISTWTAEEAAGAGNMLHGLTDTEFGNLDFSSIDVVAAVGVSGDLSSVSRLMTAFNGYLTEARGEAAASLTDSDLAAMGHVACGAETGYITDMTVDAYLGAAAEIGVLDTCELGQLQEYAKLATDDNAFGSDVSTWEEGDFTTTGSVVGGMTDAQLQQIQPDMMQHISPTALSTIPGNRFAKFSLSQLGGLSEPQLTSITVDQQDALSSDKLSFLVSQGVTDMTTVVEPDSSAGDVMVSTLLLTVTVIVSSML